MKKTRWQVIKMLRRIIFAAGIGLSAAAGCGDGMPVDLPPDALLVSETPIEQDQSSRQDASGTLPGTSPIVAYEFDKDGDGNPEYTETGESNDGAFDGVADMLFEEPGDYTPTVTAIDAAGLSDSDSSYVGVGFGGEAQRAYDYIEGFLTGIGYSCTQNQDFQLFNPLTGQMTAYTGMKAEISDIVMYVLYDPGSLSQEQRDTLAARESEGIEPYTRVIERSHSPLTIESVLSE
jgi:hypothetical protein